MGLISGGQQDPVVLRSAAGALGSICDGASAGIQQRAADAGAMEALLGLIRGSQQDKDVPRSAGAEVLDDAA